MKLDILKKLVALANNNPNDNEANLAARKVCKALMEDKYIDQLREATYTYTTPPVAPRPSPSVYDDLMDLMNKAKQEARQQARKPPEQAWYYQGDPFEEFFNIRDRQTRAKEQQKHSKKYKPPKGFYVDPVTGEIKEGKLLKCKTCKKQKGTKFVGAEELFECNDCQWTAYAKEKTDKEQQKKAEGICGFSGKKCPTPVTCAGMGCSYRV